VTDFFGQSRFFGQQLANGITPGGVYALIAVGNTMVHGVIQLINFAHGEIYMLGASLAYTMVAFLGLPLAVAFVLTVCLCACLGITLDYAAYRPLRKAHRLAALITAMGMSIFLQKLVVLLVLTRLEDSRIGRAWYAIRADEIATQCCGVNLIRCKVTAFAVSASIGAVGGAFFARWFPFLHPDMFKFWKSILVLCLIVFGGIGRIAGTMLGALVLIPLSEILGMVLPQGLVQRPLPHLRRRLGVDDALAPRRSHSFRSGPGVQRPPDMQAPGTGGGQ